MKNLPAKFPPWSAKAVNDVGRSCNAVIVSGTAWITVRGAGATCEMGVTNAAADPAHSRSDAVLMANTIYMPVFYAAKWSRCRCAVV